MSWPPRWDGPHWKKPIADKVTKTLERRELVSAEDREKAKVRVRDKFCRFPRCGCKKFNLALHVSHQQHKGMGGNPKGDRTVAALMVYVCVARHKENTIAIDRGTLRWRALTPAGANGPIAWDVAKGGKQKWLEVARESAVQVLEPSTPQQLEVLRELAKMTT